MAFLSLTPLDPAEMKEGDHPLWFTFQQPGDSIRCVIDIEFLMRHSILATPHWIMKELCLPECKYEWLDEGDIHGLNIFTLSDILLKGSREFPVLGEYHGKYSVRPDGVYRKTSPFETTPDPSLCICASPIIASKRFIEVVSGLADSGKETQCRKFDVIEWASEPDRLCKEVLRFCFKKGLVTEEDSLKLHNFILMMVEYATGYSQNEILSLMRTRKYAQVG